MEHKLLPEEIQDRFKQAARTPEIVRQVRINEAIEWAKKTYPKFFREDDGDFPEFNY